MWFSTAQLAQDSILQEQSSKEEPSGRMESKGPLAPKRTRCEQNYA